MTEGLVTTAEACRLLDVTPRTIARWKAAGCPCEPGANRSSAPVADLWNPAAGWDAPAVETDAIKGDMWNIAAVVAWTRANGKDTNATNSKQTRRKKKPAATPAGGGSEPSGDPDEDLTREKVRKERALASRYELELEVRRGELIERKKQEELNVRKFSEIRNALLAHPGSMAGVLVGLDESAIRKRLEVAVDHILTQLSGKGPIKPEETKPEFPRQDEGSE